MSVVYHYREARKEASQHEPTTPLVAWAKKKAPGGSRASQVHEKDPWQLHPLAGRPHPVATPLTSGCICHMEVASSVWEVVSGSE